MQREKYQSALHATGQYASSSITCRYTIPNSIRDQCASASSNQPLRDAFFAALARTVLEHPLLLVGQIKEDSRSPAWVELETLDLHQQVDWTLVEPDNDFETLVRKTISTQLDTFYDHLETKPGWRLAVLQKARDLHAIEVILNWNHANFDGTGAKIFHQTLLRNLNRHDDDDEAVNWAKPGILKLDSVAARFPPPITRLGKFTISKKWALSFGWKNLKPSMFRGHNQYDVAWAPIHLSPRRTLSATFSVSNAELRVLLESCRAHKTTISGLLMALAVTSLAVQSRNDGLLNGVELEGLTTDTAIDLRRHLTTKSEKHPWVVPDELLTNAVTIAQHEFDADLIQSIRDAAKSAPSDDQLFTSISDSLWDVASRTRRHLEKKIATGLHNEINSMLSLVPDWRAEHKDQAMKSRLAGLVVTNLGVLDGGDKNDDGTWGIDNTRFHLSVGTTSQPIQISAITIKGGDMVVDIDWQEGVLPDDVSGPLVANIQSWIRTLSRVNA